MLAAIDIIAAGVLGEEQMSLQIDGQTVQTWTDLGGNAYQGQFLTFSYSDANPVTADQVRVTFDNDFYDPANGIDRNLRVDAIVIDGTRFETEDPLVYSTGTWRPSDGATPGFRESEYLHTTGYFQYKTPIGSDQTLIQIRAAGDESIEQFDLQIDTTTVASFTTTDLMQVFEYTASGVVTADQIRVVFTNDYYDPANGIDRNLSVDFITVGGVVYETEAPNVLTTGTWRPLDGVTPGFRQTQRLHTNGYFAYEQLIEPGVISLESSVIDVVESDGLASVTILREDGTGGTITVDYRTVEGTATAGSDYTDTSGTVTFLDGEVSKTIQIPLSDDAVVESNEQFSFTIDNVTGGATLLVPRTATITIDDNDSIQAAGDGLLGEYFDELNLIDPFTHRIDSTVDFDWGAAAPIDGMGNNTFSVRWSGQIEPLYSETYTFQTLSDDGIRLWVDNQLIIDQWINQSATIQTGTIDVQAGQLYDIRMEHYENTGSAVAQLSWSSPSQTLEVIPESQLYSADPPIITPGDQLETQTLITGLVQPTSLDFSPDGTKMYISEQRGIVRVVDNGNLVEAPFLDFTDRVNGTRDRGLLDIAVHPDFANNPYVYLLYTYDPVEVYNYSPGTLPGPDGKGNRAGRLTRVTADAANDYNSIIAGSEVVLVGGNSTWGNFNAFVNSTVNFSEPPAGVFSDGTNLQDFIATDSESHTVGAIEFGPDGSLFASIGDGTSYNQVDPRTVRVQDIDNLSGKILRIDPITGLGISDNPFFETGDPNSNRSKVYQYGVRNAFRMTVDQSDGQVYVGDVGWTQWEEINSAAPGANFGWPYYEGGSGTSNQTNGYKNLQEAQDFYASGQSVTPSIYALNHAASGINAIVLGDFSTGSAYPAEYQGDLFFNDLGQGIVRNISFDAGGNITSVDTFATGAQVVVQIVEGPDGNLYFVDLDDGAVGRWVFVENGQGSAAATQSEIAPVGGFNLDSTSVGAGITVATIDSGIDLNHPNLASNVWVNSNEIPDDGLDNDGNGYVDDVFGYDFVDLDNQPFDLNGHGTFTAGLIAGSETGIATGTTIMPLRVLDADGNGSTIAIASAVYYAVNNGADIISMPLSTAASPAILEALEFAADRDVMVVVAAGNDGASTPGWLASLSAELDNVLSVGAIEANGHLLENSNLVGDSGAVQIDARGVAFGILPDQQWTTFQGTSVAAATVSAAAALALSENPQLTASQMRELLVENANITGSGSDSAGVLNTNDTVEAAIRSTQFYQVVNGNVLYIGTSNSNDSVHFNIDTDHVVINGMTYEIQAGFERIVINGRDGLDRITFGDSIHDDSAIAQNGFARLSSPTQVAIGNSFEYVHFNAATGNDSIWMRGSTGDDVAAIDRDQVSLTGDDYYRGGFGFETVRILGDGGFDEASMIGSDANEWFYGSVNFARIWNDAFFAQVSGFDHVDTDMGGGFDPVILVGSSSSEDVILTPGSAQFSGDSHNYLIDGIERSTNYADAGIDSLTIFDSADEDILYSRPQNTFLLGAGFDHRGYGFELTTVTSSGGTDRAVLHGSESVETLTAGPVETRYQGADFETNLSSFPSVLVFGGGGDDTANYIGSDGDESFYFSPTLATLSGAGFAITAIDFELHSFDGNGGSDWARLVDGSADDQLLVGNTETTLQSEDYSVSVTDIDSLFARSVDDTGDDTLDIVDSELDFEFSHVGDWVLI